MVTSQKILVIGAGELGYRVLYSTVRHPRQASAVAVLLRPSSLSFMNSSEQKDIEKMRSLDIGRFTAEIVFGDDAEELFADCPVFVGGDTVSYEQLAQLVKKTVQKSMKRNTLAVSDVLDALARDPDNVLLKYQAVFGQGKGVAWDLSRTWIAQRGVRALATGELAQDNLH